MKKMIIYFVIACVNLLACQGQNKAQIPDIDELIKMSKNPEYALPICGWQITEIITKGHAEKIGMKVGDIILPDSNNDSINFSQEVGSECAWIDKSYKVKKVKRPAEILGFRYQYVRNIPFWYLSYGNRSDLWDREVLTALYAQSIDPALSRTKWREAVKNGYRPDTLAHWSMLCCAFNLNDRPAFKTHRQALGDIQAPVKKSDFLHQYRDWVMIGLALGDMELLEHISTRFPKDDVYFSPILAAEFVKLAKKNPLPEMLPSKAADKMKRKSFLPDAALRKQKFAYAEEKSTLLELAEAVADEPPYQFPPILFEVTSNHYKKLSISPAVPEKNIDVQMEFKFHPNSLQIEKFSNFIAELNFGIIHFQLKPGTGKNGIPEEFLSAKISNTRLLAGCKTTGICNRHKSIEVASDKFGKYRFTAFPYFEIDKDKFTVVRSVKVGNWVEELIDGRTVSLMPVPEDMGQDLSLYMKNVGSALYIRSLRGDFLR
jgi:hypothetical protein